MCLIRIRSCLAHSKRQHSTLGSVIAWIGLMQLNGCQALAAGFFKNNWILWPHEIKFKYYRWLPNCWNWVTLLVHTNWGLLPTFITGKFALFLWLGFSVFEAIFGYKFLFLKFELHRIFIHNDGYALRFNYWYIILVETFQKRPKMT